MMLLRSLIDPVLRALPDPLRGSSLPWEPAGGGGPQNPARDTALGMAFDGSSFSGTNANTAGNADVLSAALGQDTQQWTLAGWFLPYTLAGLNTYFANADGAANRFAVVGGSSGANAGRIRAMFGAATPTTTFPTNKFTDASHVVAGTEAHICVVVDLSAGTQAARCTIYVNGAEVASGVNGSIPGSIATNAVAFTIGQATGVATASALPFHGRIRDVRVWVDKACSGAEVATIYAGGAVTGETARWTLNGALDDSVGSADFTAAPAAPAGPQYVMVTSAFPFGTGTRVGFLTDSIGIGTNAIGHMRAELQLQAWHRYGKRVDLVGPFVTDPFSSSMLDIQHGALSDREIGADASDTSPVPSARYVIANGYLAASPCDLLILGVATNDITAGTTGADTLTRMGALIDEIRAITAARIGIWTPPRINGATDTERANYTAGLAALAAGKTAVDVISTEETQGSIRGLASGDNVHPGAAMARKFGGAIAAWLNGVVV